MKKNLILIITVLFSMSLSSCLKCMECEISDVNGELVGTNKQCGSTEQEIKDKVKEDVGGNIQDENISCF